MKKKKTVYSHLQSVVAIGNFDGLHLGHQRIIEKMLEIAAREKSPSFLLTFEPYPHTYFNPSIKKSRLTSLREKVLFLKQKYPALQGIYVLRFNQVLAQCSPEKFIKDYLIDLMNPSHVVIGEDFKFGHQRRGDSEYLKKFFRVEIVPFAYLNERRISSTWLREILREADFDLAKKCLGRSYSIVGKVIQGRQQGRVLGIPTANIAMLSRISPIQGVYAVKVSFQNQLWNGVANIGVRPTAQTHDQVFLEVHLFNFDQSLYGQYIEVFFLQKIRDEQRFESFAALKIQIDKDIDKARHLLELKP